jgi:hypothetical protein
VALSRIVLAWIVVAGWFLLWEASSSRIPGKSGARLSAPAWASAGEALLLTLLGALWFGSIGCGGWWLVFALVGGLREWPSPREGRRPRRRDWRELAGRGAGVVRVVVAGAWLAWRLGPA